jgi:hypothetical protein
MQNKIMFFSHLALLQLHFLYKLAMKIVHNVLVHMKVVSFSLVMMMAPAMVVVIMIVSDYHCPSQQT